MSHIYPSFKTYSLVLVNTMFSIPKETFITAKHCAYQHALLSSMSNVFLIKD